jgi:phosphopantetheine--protein transferase-like protein
LSDRFSFVHEHAHGVLVAAPIDERHAGALSADERALASTYAERRLRTFATGRAVLKDALARAGGHADSIARSARGAPILPGGYRGSLSHKDEIAVALVAASHEDVTLGVDVELADAATRDITSHVLTPREIDALAHLRDEARARAVIERFSVKEAFYKAIDPKLGRFVGFLEVEVELDDDGRTRFVTPVLDALQPLTVEGLVWRRDDVVVTSVRIQAVWLRFGTASSQSKSRCQPSWSASSPPSRRGGPR